jgi:hypothetical protein
VVAVVSALDGLCMVFLLSRAGRLVTSQPGQRCAQFLRIQNF